jgi:hypothetical protein
MYEELGETKFTHQYAEGLPKIEMVLRVDAPLTELLESFENFLRAMGFHFTGSLDLVNDDLERNGETDTVAH